MPPSVLASDQRVGELVLYKAVIALRLQIRNMQGISMCRNQVVSLVAMSTKTEGQGTSFLCDMMTTVLGLIEVLCPVVRLLSRSAPIFACRHRMSQLIELHAFIPVEAMSTGNPLYMVQVAFMEWVDPIFAGGHWTPQLIELAGGAHPLNPCRNGAGAPPSTVVAPEVMTTGWCVVLGGGGGGGSGVVGYKRKRLVCVHPRLEARGRTLRLCCLVCILTQNDPSNRLQPVVNHVCA